MKKTKKKTTKRSVSRAAAAKKKPAPGPRRVAAKTRPKRAVRPRSARTAPGGHKRQIITMFAQEVPITLRLMKSYPAGKDTFTPHERSAPAVRLAHTFAMSNGVAVKAILGELHMPPEFPPAPATYTEAVESYERGARELLEALERMPESRLTETVEFFTGPRQTGQIPVGNLLWLMLLDAIHHRGQLSVYVRMAGGKVPSIYGPSADEPWI